MTAWFQRSLWVSAAYFIGFFLAIFVSIILPDGSPLQDIASGLAAAIICTTPILLLVILIFALNERLRGGQREKPKRDWSQDLYADDDLRLQHILSRLSADDRAFLEAQLARRNIGLHDDGELVSLDDLLDDERHSPF